MLFRSAELDEVICKSDIISMHVPLNRYGLEPTFHLASDSFFGAMKKGSWFINTSRGEVVETSALIKALKSKHIAGAILDVWENEPDIDLELMSMADIATPHIAGYSADGKANGTAMSVQAVSRFFDLGLNAWRPESIPSAPVNKFEIEGAGKITEEIFTFVSLQAYNIIDDSNKLKLNPQAFESHRGSYPVRNEPESLKVNITDKDPKAQKLLVDLGYNVIG